MELRRKCKYFLTYIILAAAVVGMNQAAASVLAGEEQGVPPAVTFKYAALILIPLVFILITAGSIAWSRTLRVQIARKTQELQEEVAERRKAEEALRESQEEMYVVFESMVDAVTVTDGEGKFIGLNAAAAKLHGYDSADELIGKTFFEFISEKDIERVTGRFKKAMENKEKVIRNFEVLCKTRDGREIPVRLNVTNRWGAGGEFLESVAVIHDITEIKKAEEELKKSKEELEAESWGLKKTNEGVRLLYKELEEKTKELEAAYNKLKQTEIQLVQASKMAVVGQLASGVAHEINNPLTGVLNNAQFLIRELKEGRDLDRAELKDLLGVMEEAGLRCKRIVQSLLEFSRIPKGPFKHILLNEAISKALSLIENEINQEGIVIQKQLPPDLPHILGDPQLLQQVVFNIVANSRWAIRQKAGKDVGLIIIRTSHMPDEKKVLLSISDNGVGIPKENLDKIFEPFFSTKAVGEGTGLGLSIVYNIIKQHNGAIAIESEPDKGTTCNIYLPV